ncbi:MAG: HAD family phosphatase [Candidatus Woesearchaeota archaeon]|nr:MAG: HAD family phosphatase [Candidatus Woesearchaeota archaeon]
MTFKLICFDMDGVLFDQRNFWMEVHKVFGTLEEGKVLTETYLHADYEKLIEEVIGRLWLGRDATPYYELVNSLQYIPGIAELFAHIKKEGYMTAIISGASLAVARRVQKDFGVDFLLANDVRIENNKFTKDFFWPVGNGHDNKAELVKQLSKLLSIPLEQITFIGDSQNDAAAFKIVGTSIAFNTDDDDVLAKATHQVKAKDLRQLIPLL